VIKDFFAGLFNKEVRQQQAFDKLVGRLVSKNMQHEERLAAIEQLAAEDSDRAIAALFRRWDLTADKQREDLAEKELLRDVLIEKGGRVLPHLKAHNDRSVNITWPLHVLKAVVEEVELVDELLRVLGKEQARVAAFKPEKKVALLRLLSDYDDARITAAACASLDDFDPDVRFEAIQLIVRVGDDSARGPLVDRLISDDEDAGRVREAILECLATRQWSVADRRADVTPHLGTRFEIAGSGQVQPRA
jgi:hypothetical protein